MGIRGEYYLPWWCWFVLEDDVLFTLMLMSRCFLPCWAWLLRIVVAELPKVVDVVGTYVVRRYLSGEGSATC